MFSFSETWLYLTISKLITSIFQELVYTYFKKLFSKTSFYTYFKTRELYFVQKPFLRIFYTYQMFISIYKTINNNVVNTNFVTISNH